MSRTKALGHNALRTRIRKSQQGLLDNEILSSIQGEREDALDRVACCLDSLKSVRSQSMTGRIKSIRTICDKIMRGTRFKKIRDIAGVRIVLKDCTLFHQKEFVKKIISIFSTRETQTIDRIKRPQYGYRAIHVEVQYESGPLEIQVRTQLQHDWAQVNERFGDILGRQIRYEEKPKNLRSIEVKGTTQPGEDVVTQLRQVSLMISDVEEGRSRRSVNDIVEHMRPFVEVLRDVLPRDHRITQKNRAEEAPDGRYIVSYDRSKCEATFMNRGEFTLQETWKKAEEAASYDSNIEVVVLSSSSVDALNITHARYFTSMPGLDMPL